METLKMRFQYGFFVRTAPGQPAMSYIAVIPLTDGSKCTMVYQTRFGGPATWAGRCE
jgi:hypothetical protein